MPKHCSKSEVPNWYVITGGPSSGKTTILDELTRLGFTTFPDAARVLIDKEIKKGKSIKEIRKNEADFQRRVLKIKIEAEKKAPKDKVIFFDRGIPCSIAYYQTCGLDPKEILKACPENRYKKVFFLEQLPVKKDYARTEDEKAIKDLNMILQKSYQDLGYKLINIPVAPKEVRVRKILEEIKNA